MLLMSSLQLLSFLGGWLPILNIAPFTLLPGVFWFSFKLVFRGNFFYYDESLITKI